MLQLFFCPTFKIISLTSIFFLFNLMIFIILISVFGISHQYMTFLGTKNSILRLLGKYPFYIKYDFQAWRWFSAIFIHTSFTHFTTNSFALLIIGSFVEKSYGTLKFLSIYLITGIGANIFSSLVSDQVSVGCSTSLFGLIGAWLGYFYIDWCYHAVNMDPEERRNYVRFFLCFSFMLFVILLLGFLSGHVDAWGHISGLFIGFVCSFAIPGSQFSNFLNENLPMMLSKKTSRYGLFFFFNFSVMIFYLFRTPHK